MALLLSVWIAGANVCCGAAMVCKAKTNASLNTDDKVMKEIEEFVTAFYEAHTETGIDLLGNYIEDKENLNIYVAGYKAAFAYGVQKYDNIDVDVYPLYQDEYWIAYVCSDMVIENADIGLPGAAAHLVHKGENGNYYIITDVSDGMELPEDMNEQMERVLPTDEVYEKILECNAKYNEIISENQEIMEWVYDLSNAINQAKADAAIDREEAVSVKRDDVYIVKKGDCLWSIAEEQLDGGMYWGRIYEQNKSIIGDNPDLLFVGIELQLDK